MKKVILIGLMLAMVGCNSANRKVVGVNKTQLNNYEYKLSDGDGNFILITSKEVLDMEIDDKIRVEKVK